LPGALFTSTNLPGSQGQFGGLFGQGFDDLRVAVTLVDCRVGTQVVEVAFSLHIPDERPLSPREGHRQWVVVVGAVFVFTGVDGLGKGSGR